MYSVLDDDNVPALTPTSTLKVMGAIIDIPGGEMHVANCGGAVTKITEIDTGHQQHNFKVKEGEQFISIPAREDVRVVLDAKCQNGVGILCRH